MEIYCYNPRAREKLQLGWQREQELPTIARKTSYIPQPIYCLGALISKVWWSCAPWQLWGLGTLRSDGMENGAVSLFDSPVGVCSGQLPARGPYRSSSACLLPFLWGRPSPDTVLTRELNPQTWCPERPALPLVLGAMQKRIVCPRASHCLSPS